MGSSNSNSNPNSNSNTTTNIPNNEKNNKNNVNATTNEFLVSINELTKSENESGKYIIKNIAEEKFQKLKGLYFLNQCSSSTNKKFQNFFDNDSLSNSSMVFFYSPKKEIKSYDELITFRPFSNNNLSKVLIISYNEPIQENISADLIKNSLKNLKEIKNYQVLNFGNAKSKNDQNNDQNNKMLVSISMDGSMNQFANLNPGLKDETYLIMGNITSDTINITKNLLFNGEDPKNNNFNYQIQHIMIKNSQISDIKIFSELMNLIKKFPVKMFTFSDNIIENDLDVWKYILDFISNSNIRHIDLHCCKLMDNFMKSLINALSKKQLQIIDIGENYFTYNSMKLFSEFLLNMPYIQKLYLRNNSRNNFKAEGVKYIMEGLKNNDCINLLEFSEMDITSSGEFLSELIFGKKNLEFLFLKNCKLNCKDFKSIFEAIANTDNIKEIDVSFNNMGGDKALEYLAQAIKKNKSLTYLGIDKLNINMDNYKIIFDAIENNKNISKYSFSYNSGMKPKIVLNFFLPLKHVKFLEYIPFNAKEDKGKELTLEEKKLIEQFKNERKDMEFIYKEDD